MVPERATVTGIAQLLALALSISPSAGRDARADSLARPLYIDFDFGNAAPLKNHPKAAELEGEIAAKLVQLCKDRAFSENFPWDIRAGRDRFPGLKLVLIEDDRRTTWSLAAEGYNTAGSLKWKSEPKIVSVAIDAGYPRREELTRRLGEWFQEKFLKPDAGRKFLAELKGVAPLGDGLVRLEQAPAGAGPYPLGILWLEWGEYQRLAKSEFMFVCPVEGGAPIKLISVGDGIKVPCVLPPQRGGKTIAGILVHHTKYEDQPIDPTHQPALKKLTYGTFFLENYVDAMFGLTATDFVATDQ